MKTYEWCEPHPSLSKEGNEGFSSITLSASEEDCIGLSRYANSKRKTPIMGLSDEDLLDEFIIINWATIKVPPH